jgi:hypothetical protein
MTESLLNGKLYLPNRDKFIQAIGPELTEITDQFFTSLWHLYLLNKGSTSLPYWADKFNDPKVFNIVLMSLAKAGWIITHSIPARNWGEAMINENKLLQYVSSSQLKQIRAYHKFTSYISENKEAKQSNRTKLAGKVTVTGIIREGFQLAGNTRYQYDTKLMEDYQYVLERNITKSMDKVKVKHPEFSSDETTYDSISIAILDYHISNPDMVMTRGENINDSRGRAISGALTKVFNPISSKDARSLLIIPE